MNVARVRVCPPTTDDSMVEFAMVHVAFRYTEFAWNAGTVTATTSGINTAIAATKIDAKIITLDNNMPKIHRIKGRCLLRQNKMYSSSGWLERL